MDKKRLARISGAMEIPAEVITGFPKISMIGNYELYLENHSGIIQYTAERIRLRTKIGEVIISGSDLSLRALTTDTLTVGGEIVSVEYATRTAAL